MSDFKFEELVNLFLDNELTVGEFELLRAELRLNKERRQTFELYCRMHRASCAALSGQCALDRPLGVSANRPSFTTGIDRKLVFLSRAGLFAATFALGLVIYSSFRGRDSVEPAFRARAWAGAEVATVAEESAPRRSPSVLQVRFSTGDDLLDYSVDPGPATAIERMRASWDTPVTPAVIPLAWFQRELDRSRFPLFETGQVTNQRVILMTSKYPEFNRDAVSFTFQR